MASQLTTGSSSGTQTGTQSPQASVGTTPRTAQAGSVQPGTATNLLNNEKAGVALQGKQLSVVNIGARQSQISQYAPPTAKDTNPLLFGVSGLLLIIAIYMFWVSAHTTKNTTD